MYDIILQNNADKRVFILSGMTNVSQSHLWLGFENVELPEGAEDGEYTYAVIRNVLRGVTYDPKAEVLDTIVTYEESSVTLRDLKPMVGILRVGTPATKNVYKADNKKNYYYQK